MPRGRKRKINDYIPPRWIPNSSSEDEHVGDDPLDGLLFDHGADVNHGAADLDNAGNNFSSTELNKIPIHQIIHGT